MASKIAQGLARNLNQKNESNQMLLRLNQEMVQVHGRMFKQSQELYEFVNLRLNEYATQGQISSLRTQIGNFTPLEDFVKHKENFILLSNEI